MTHDNKVLLMWVVINVILWSMMGMAGVNGTFSISSPDKMLVTCTGVGAAIIGGILAPLAPKIELMINR